jgi:Zn-dependent protease
MPEETMKKICTKLKMIIINNKNGCSGKEIFIMKKNHCTVCVQPLIALMEIILIFSLLCAFPFPALPGFNFIDYLVISILILSGSLGSLFTHEYAHLRAALWMHLPVQGITLSLLGAYTAIDEEPSTPKEAFIVSVAGPLINIFLGLIFYAGHLALKDSDIATTVCFCLSVFNGILSCYNLLPVIPLDGGLIMRAAFWRVSSNFAWANQMSFNIGNGLTLICFMTGIICIFLGNPIVSVISFVVGLSIWQSAESAYRQMSAVKLLNALMQKNC